MVDEESVQDQSDKPDTQEPPLAPALEESDPQLAAPEQVAAPATAAARLVVKRSGAETDVEFPIHPPAVIGRFDPAVGPVDIDLAGLPEGVYVSRKHAMITCDDGIWKVHDLGSSNGTFVLRSYFEKVDEADLSDGQEIALGNARFVFHLSS